MLDNSFRTRYKTVPAAINMQNDFHMTLPHNHEEFEILIIEKGKCDIRIGDNVRECCAGDIVFVNPMEIHSVTPYHKDEYNHKCICFDVSMITDNTVKDKFKKEELCLERYIPNESKNCGILREYAVKIYNEVLNESNTSFMEVSAYVSLIAAHMLKNNLSEKKAVKTERFSAEVLKYVSMYYSENITSKQAAENLHFTQSYFCRHFKKDFGMSFSQYLNFYRVTQAGHLIETSGKNISDIAFECGFTDPVYFTKVFKKYMGVIPSAYKKVNI